MYQILPQLILYGNLRNDSILNTLDEVTYSIGENKSGMDLLQRNSLITKVHSSINNLLQVAIEHGFTMDLWQNYIAYLIAMNENPFSLSVEGTKDREDSLKEIVLKELKYIKELFFYDFSKIENFLGISVFSTISSSNQCPNKKSINPLLSERVIGLYVELKECNNEIEMYHVIRNFYKSYGVGILGLNKAFRLGKVKNELSLLAIQTANNIKLSNLIGYEIQKKKLIDNTEAFIHGYKCNNVLLFGDSGTGKSTSVKAILNQYYDKGLRMIELYKHEFKDLSALIGMLRMRNYKFIIFMDDLSFEEFEIEYKYLKAVIEGGLEEKPDNILIYATSNRRHLIRETWSDRSDMSKDELHHSDTMEEKLSLVSRFGVTINFSSPNQSEFFEIVKELARKEGITLSEDELLKKANMWELSHGGKSGRTAQQFIHYLSHMESQT